MISGLLALTLSLAIAAGDDRIICVPKQDGTGWDCGKGDAAPAPRALPREHSRATPTAPPPYLMDPARMPAVMQESIEPPSPPPAAAAPPEPATAATETPPFAAGTRAAPEPPPVADAEPIASPAPAEPTPEPAAPSAPEPAPTPEPPPAPPPSPAPAPEPTPEPTAAPTPAPVTRSISSVARDASELLALPGSAYTVQLTAARSELGFAEFRKRLGIAVEDTFVVSVRRGNETWYLMLWRDFPDLASARSAAATLQGSYWPRRLAPLQSEVRATPN